MGIYLYMAIADVNSRPNDVWLDNNNTYHHFNRSKRGIFDTNSSLTSESEIL